MDRISRKALLPLGRNLAGSAFLVLATLFSQPLFAQGNTIFPGLTAVSGSAPSQMATVTLRSQGTVASVEVLTLGSPNLDFTDAGGGTCAPGNAYSPGQSCTVAVEFSPRHAGVRSGAVVLLDGSRNVLGTEYLSGVGQGALAVMVPGTITTIAGDGLYVSVNDGSPATQADLDLPSGVAADGAGNLYIADSAHNRIRRVDGKTGIISTIVGDGSATYSGDGGLAANATLNTPSSVFVDGAGNLYIADSGNNAIRKVTASTGIISTVAGHSAPSGFSGDNGPATAASLDTPMGITLDAAGSLYIADTFNQRIRKVDAVSGIITTIAGNGYSAGNGNGGFSGEGGPALSAELNQPYAVTFDAAGNMFIPDSGNNRIRRVDSTGTITTVAGNGTQGFSGEGGAATAAELYSPSSVVFDAAGNMYIADTQNYRVRKVSAMTGTIETIAGNGTGGGGNGDVGDGSNATSAVVYGPYDVFLDAAGNLDIAEHFNMRIRQISSSVATLRFSPPAIRQGQVSPPLPQGIENDGNAPLTFSAIAPDANAAVDANTTTCSLSTSLATDDSCSVGAEFAPTQAGNPVNGNINISGNPVNSPLDIVVTGQALPLNSTSVLLVSTPNPSTFGQAVSFSVSVTSGTGTPTGMVVFKDGTTTLSTQTLVGSAASYTTSTLTVGVHTITVLYNGDSDHGASTSNIVTQTVQGATSVTVTSSKDPSLVNTPITLTATVAAKSGGATPTGTVVFYDGSAVIGNGALNPAGAASYTTSGLSAGTHLISASYSGDSSNLAATSPVFTQTVQQQTTATVVTSSLNPSTFRSAVTFAATVTVTGTGAATGTVTFKDGATTLGTASLNAGGQAIFPTSLLAVGAHSIVALYGGDASNATSASSAITQTVQQVTTSTALAASANPGNAGATITLTANVTGASGVPLTGSVTFKDGGTAIGTGTLNSTGVATLAISNLTVGTHTLTATYGGDTDNFSSTSAPLPEKIQQATTAIALGSSPNPSIAGNAVTLSATVTGNGGIATGNVTFKDGAATLGTVVLSGAGTAAFPATGLTVGPHTLTAVYAGDPGDTSSTSNAVVQTVQQAQTTTVLTASPSPANAGTTVYLNAVVTGDAPTGTVTFKDGTNIIGTGVVSGGVAKFSLSTLAVGPHTLLAVYSGDSNNASSGSAPISEDVQQNTRLTVTPSANPSYAGAGVTFTAALSGTTPNPTGQVILQDNGAAIAQGAVNGSTTVNFLIKTLSPATHAITAVYAGDSNNAAATSPVLTQNVLQAITTTVAAVSSSSPTAGSALTITATVTGNGGTPGGTVSFQDGSTILASNIPLVNGTAVYRITSINAGPHSVTAIYSGDTNDKGSTSSTVSLNAPQAGTVTAIASSQPVSNAGTQVAFTATVSGTGGVPTGTVVFKDGGTPIGTGTLANGAAKFSTAALAIGQHSITASYSGDTNDQASTSPAFTQTVQQAVSKIAITSSLDPSTVSAQVTFAATVTSTGSVPTGTVVFEDGATAIGSGSINGSGVAVFTTPSLATGQHSITANYAGDANNGASVSAPLNQVVQQATTTTLTTNKPVTVGGTPVVLTASVVGANGSSKLTGSVTFKSGALTLGSAALNGGGAAALTTSALAVGQDAITATYSGDTTDLGSISAPLNETVQQAVTKTVIGSTPNPSLFNAAVTFTVNVTGTGIAPTGTVTIRDGGATLGTVSLNGNGVATYSTSTLAVGSHAITATYSGDTDDQASTSTVLNQVVQQQTTTTVSASANPALATVNVLFTAKVVNAAGTPLTGTVIFKDGATLLSTQNLANGTAAYSTAALPVGQHAITATYSGDALDAGSTSSVLTETVQPIPTSTSLGSSAASVTTDQPLTLISTVTSSLGNIPTGAVTYRSGTTVIGTGTVNNAGVATLSPSLSAGTYTITATYSGDAIDAGSVSGTVTVTVTQASDFSVTINPTAVSVQSSQNSTVSITLQSAAGFADQVGLGCASLPADVTCTFSKPSVSLAANGSQTVQLTIDTGSPLTAGGVAKNTAPDSSSPVSLAWIFPGGALLGWFSLRARKKGSSPSWLLMLVVAAAACAIPGCASLHMTSTPPGSYTFQVTTNAAKTGISHTTNVTLTVK